MTSIARLTEALQKALGSNATELGRKSGFVRRESKLTASAFLQTLVCTWLNNPDATLEELSQMASLVGVTITPQGLDERFTPQAAEFLKQALEAAAQEMLSGDPAAVPLLERFTGVYLLDGTTIVLPDALAGVWDGGGCPAAVKVEVGWDVRDGHLQGLLLQPARAHDRTTPLQHAPLPSGALRLCDLGYFDLEVLQSLATEGAFWLTRLRVGTIVFTPDGQRWDLPALLRCRDAGRIDIEVEAGVNQRVHCRLVAQRVPPEVAEERRRSLKKEARRRGQAVSQARLCLADWNYWITNVPTELLSTDEVFVIARVRWQIELLFKLWKSHGHVDQWRSANPWRILCEVYGKLLAMLVQHWLLLGCWQYANRSLWKAATMVRKLACLLAMQLADDERLAQVLDVIMHALATGRRINTSRAKPHTYQLLLDASEEA